MKTSYLFARINVRHLISHRLKSAALPQIYHLKCKQSIQHMSECCENINKQEIWYQKTAKKWLETTTHNWFGKKPFKHDFYMFSQEAGNSRDRLIWLILAWVFYPMHCVLKREKIRLNLCLPQFSIPKNVKCVKIYFSSISKCVEWKSEKSEALRDK
jgi:hypothetical protein